jgi:hypothetical protein
MGSEQGPPKALLVSPDLALHERIEPLFESAGVFCDRIDASDAMQVPTGVVLLVDYDRLPFRDRQRLLEPRPRERPWCVLSDHACRADLPDLLTAGVVDHLFPRGAGLDLRAALRIHQQVVPFGLRAFVPDVQKAQVFELRCSADKAAFQQRFDAILRENEAPGRAVRTLTFAAEELLSNALYDAPVDEQGRPRNAHLSRTEEIQLRADEKIEVEVVFGATHAGIAVKDPFGALRRPTVEASLARCLRRGADQVDGKQGGAGLGLYMMFQTACSLAVAVTSGRRTEVLAIAELGRGPRLAEGDARSLHLFFD